MFLKEFKEEIGYILIKLYVFFKGIIFVLDYS